MLTEMTVPFDRKLKSRPSTEGYRVDKNIFVFFLSKTHTSEAGTKPEIKFMGQTNTYMAI